MTNLMENKSLYLHPRQRVKGLVVYCRKCNTNVYDLCRKTGKALQKCPFSNRHFFKCYAYEEGTGKRRTKFFDTKDANEAMLQAIQFHNEVKSNKAQLHIYKEESKKPETKNNKAILLPHLAARYVAYLKADTQLFPEVMVREKSKAHIRDVKWVIKQLAICLTKNGYNFNQLKPEDIGINEINIFHRYLLKERNLSDRTFNKSMTLLSGFYKFLNEVEGIKVENVFRTIPHKSLNTEEKINVPSQKQVEEIIEKMKHKDLGWTGSESGFKSMYREWMPDLVRLAVFTGRRNEELVNMKFSDIKQDNNGNLYIKCPDFKVNRIRNLQGDKMKYVYVPVIKELFGLLLELGYEKYQNDNRYLIAHDETMTREYMKSFISRSFTHFAKDVKSEYPIKFKSLRKLYITHLTKFIGAEQARQITGHSNTKILQASYLDAKVLVSAAKDFRVFENGNGNNNHQREDNLQKAREQKINGKESSLNR